MSDFDKTISCFLSEMFYKILQRYLQGVHFANVLEILLYFSFKNHKNKYTSQNQTLFKNPLEVKKQDLRIYE